MNPPFLFARRLPRQEPNHRPRQNLRSCFRANLLLLQTEPQAQRKVDAPVGLIVLADYREGNAELYR